MKAALALVALVPAAGRAATPATSDLDAFVDRSADPRHDFFRDAGGKWLKDHPIRASERRWGIAQAVHEENARMRRINEAAAERAADGSNARRIGGFWRARRWTPTRWPRRRSTRSTTSSRASQRSLRATSSSRRSHACSAWARTRWCNLFVFQDEKHSDRYVLALAPHFRDALRLPKRGDPTRRGKRRSSHFIGGTGIAPVNT